MTQEELHNYLELNSKFTEDCERVCKEMSRFNAEFSDAWKFRCEDDSVYCEGGYSCGGEWCEVSECFPVELLTYSEEELSKYIDSLFKKQQEERQKELERKQAREKETDLKEYMRLKEKLGI